MGDTKNLAGKEAITKVQEMIDDIEICMFCTYENGKLTSRPMSAQDVDEEGNIWFLSDKNSEKNKALQNDNKVELLYAKGNSKFIAIHGKGTVVYDKEKIKELWTPIAGIWFKEGVDDPNVSLIKVSFEDGYYWDTKHGKMVEIAIMAAALLTGKTMDDGIEGTLQNS
jgi:general stress protein 26